MALFHSYTIAEEHHHRHLHCPSMDEGAHREPPQYCRHDRLVITTEVEGNHLAWCLIDFTAIADFSKSDESCKIECTASDEAAAENWDYTRLYCIRERLT